MDVLTKLRGDARAILDAGLKAADPGAAMKNLVCRDGDMLEISGERYDLSRFRNIHVVGAGKASARMAQAVEDFFGDRVTGGTVVVKRGCRLPTKKAKILEAGHPVPDAAGIEATSDLIRLVRRAGPDDLVVCLISGGGSALLCCPRAGVSLEDKQATTELLLRCGATIQEINAVRKHISQIKGGGLARSAYPATVVTLILSDVIDDPIDIIASGPTAPDPTTFADCQRILQRYGLWERLPVAVRELLMRGIRGEVAETAKDNDPIFARVKNVVMGNNRLAMQAAKEKARQLGYHSCILAGAIKGEAREAALFHAAIAKEVRRSGEPLSPPACLISGGETTVTVRGNGLGGRNQEFALAAAVEMDGVENVVFLSAGTDGTDGPTDAAGALVDGNTLRRARDKGLNALEHLRNNDAYPLLLATGDLLITGATFTNVMDLHLVLLS